jgi:hypothetical protein
MFVSQIGILSPGEELICLKSELSGQVGSGTQCSCCLSRLASISCCVLMRPKEWRQISHLPTFPTAPSCCSSCSPLLRKGTVSQEMAQNSWYPHWSCGFLFARWMPSTVESVLQRKCVYVSSPFHVKVHTEGAWVIQQRRPVLNCLHSRRPSNKTVDCISPSSMAM